MRGQPSRSCSSPARERMAEVENPVADPEEAGGGGGGGDAAVVEGTGGRSLSGKQVLFI